MRTRFLTALLLTTCVAATTFAVGAERSVASRSHSVVLKDIAFAPARLTIKRGDSVRFTWRDGDTKHNVAYASGKRFKGASTRGSGSYRVRFTKAGLYRYQCTLHLGMRGSIRVK